MPIPDTAPRQPERPQGGEPTVAALLTWFVPGAGHLYLGKLRTALVGFLVILTSGFATLQEFGYLTAFTMALCLSTDLILLPALLVKVRA